jgi:hypothetical protein
MHGRRVHIVNPGFTRGEPSVVVFCNTLNAAEPFRFTWIKVIAP